ncbi:MAG: substrate-binding domain-containing protein, partial [Devosia sp.]
MRLRSVLTSLGLVFAVATTSVQAADLVGLITKVRIPYFNAMERGAQAAADKLGLELQIYSGKSHEDYEGQIAAIESLIAAGAKGFAIAPGSSTAIVPALQKARDAGLLVIVLDTPTDPISAADATYVTDNFEAGKLDGQWAKAHMGDKWATAKFALLDAFVVPNTTETLRDQGFMQGYGFDIKDPNIMGDEAADPRICGHFVTDANDEGGRTAMEQALQKCPDLELVYTVNEPAFDGAYQALKAAGKDDGSIVLVSIDGGCDAMKNMTDG